MTVIDELVALTSSSAAALIPSGRRGAGSQRLHLAQWSSEQAKELAVQFLFLSLSLFLPFPFSPKIHSLIERVIDGWIDGWMCKGACG